MLCSRSKRRFQHAHHFQQFAGHQRAWQSGVVAHECRCQLAQRLRHRLPRQLQLWHVAQQMRCNWRTRRQRLHHRIDVASVARVDKPASRTGRRLYRCQRVSNRFKRHCINLASTIVADYTLKPKTAHKRAPRTTGAEIARSSTTKQQNLQALQQTHNIIEERHAVTQNKNTKILTCTQSTIAGLSAGGQRARARAQQAQPRFDILQRIQHRASRLPVPVVYVCAQPPNGRRASQSRKFPSPKRIGPRRSLRWRASCSGVCSALAHFELRMCAAVCVCMPIRWPAAHAR